MKIRLTFAQTRIHWVLFSEESKFNLFESEGPSYVRPSAGSRLDKKYITLTLNLVYGGCFSGFGAIEGHKHSLRSIYQ